MSKANVFAIARVAKHVAKREEVQDEFINNEDDEMQKLPKIPVPILYIESSTLRGVVSAVSNLKESS